jgi:hypothetical protein
VDAIAYEVSTASAYAGAVLLTSRQRSSAITLPSFGRLPGATSSPSARSFVIDCSVAATASASPAAAAACTQEWPMSAFAGSGPHLLSVSLSASDPERTSQA